MSNPYDPNQQRPQQGGHGAEPPGQQYPYGPAPYGPGPYPPSYGYGYPSPPARTNGLAIASMVTSICGLICYGVPGLIGAILGHVALGQIRRTGQSGRGMALAGVIVGWSTVALWASFVTVMILDYNGWLN